MKVKSIVIVVGFTFVALIVLGAISASLSPSLTQTTSISTTTSLTASSASTLSATSQAPATTPSTGYSSVVSSAQQTVTSSYTTRSATATSHPSIVTLEDIIAGRFPSASNKQGTGGVTVTVQSLQVLDGRSESDGDWHVAVTDGSVPVFITEITPSFQASEGKPAVGSTIDETGIPYCDTAHQTESWHGNTCWEIHPVTSWQLSTTSATVTTTTQIIPASLNVTISYGLNPISRGSTQTITIHAFDSDGAVSSMIISIEVDYASGQTTKYFACTTSTDGSCWVSWRIGGNSTPGTFNVKVAVEETVFYSSFEVTTA